MTVLFDANALLLLLDPKLPPPLDPVTRAPVSDVGRRINHLVNEIQREHRKIIIPTPVLSEVLVRAGAAGSEYLSRLSRAAAFRIEAFDQRCAIEVAAMTAEAIAKGDKKSGLAAPWTKVKYDRQIIGMARTHDVSMIYTDDGDMRTFATLVGISTTGMAQIPLPPEDAQLSLPWSVATDEAHPPG
jgi:predicted nucleic acid-binding protein